MKGIILSELPLSTPAKLVKIWQNDFVYYQGLF